jgi:hypothetical protein
VRAHRMDLGDDCHCGAGLSRREGRSLACKAGPDDQNVV